MGYTNAVSLKRLITEVNSSGYDAVIHVGGKVICAILRDWITPSWPPMVRIRYYLGLCVATESSR